MAPDLSLGRTSLVMAPDLSLGRTSLVMALALA